MSMSASAIFGGDRRMEAEAFLLNGFGLRTAIQARKGWLHLNHFAHVWQPSRLKGIQVSSDFGTPFLAATQVFDLRPIPRKWLSLERTEDASQRFVQKGMILVTCSGLVGRATLAYNPHLEILISHDLLRVEATAPKYWGWLYAYLRAPITRAMMTGMQYGHVIKHMEVSHLNAMPVPVLSDALLDRFSAEAKMIISLRDKAHAAVLAAEERFAEYFGALPALNNEVSGFTVSAANTLFTTRRRLDALPHNPHVQAIRYHLARRAKEFSALGATGLTMWLPTRFRRIPAESGVELVSSSALFEINPDSGKRIADSDFGDPFQGRVEAGWLLLARSGQIYGLNGSLTLATKALEGKVISDHVIRIAPSANATIRLGYVLVALSHPTLGRPLVKSLPYGSSIPEIEVADFSKMEVPRISSIAEDYIADQAEQAAAWCAEADLLETKLAQQAEQILSQFIAGESPTLLSTVPSE
jgi:hypothetical protein